MRLLAITGMPPSTVEMFGKPGRSRIETTRDGDERDYYSGSSTGTVQAFSQGMALVRVAQPTGVKLSLVWQSSACAATTKCKYDQERNPGHCRQECGHGHCIRAATNAGQRCNASSE